MSASGYIMPPHTIFSQAYPSGPYARDGTDGALYSISDNGYMDSKLFYGFIYKLFIPHINCCKTYFTKLFKDSWESITVVLVKKGFRKCGISLLDRDAINKSCLSGERAITNSQQQQSTATSSNQQLPVPEEDQTSPAHSNLPLSYQK